jgi:type IV pilus assembly protein PilO
MSVLDDLRDRPAGQKAALVGAVVLIAAVLDWQYWYGPERRALTQLTTQTSALRAELDTKRTKANARASAERELRDLAAELRRAEARLPDQREIADLLSSVAGSARGVGLDIVLFRQKPEVTHDFYAEVPVEMQMRGTYHDVALFLDRVKRLDRIVNVSDMQLKKPRVEGERVVLEGSCTATTFRFLDEAERQRLQEQKKGSKQQPKQPTKKGARTT